MTLRGKAKRYVEAGDWIVLYQSPEIMTPVQVEPGKIFYNKHGAFHHSGLVGLEYGSMFRASNGRGRLSVLRLTPELWTSVLPHRTQILYIADISFISFHLDLKPGMTVIESGTGSGSFSHSLARTLAPLGSLYTFEFHEQRAAAAQKEFDAHGLEGLVNVEWRDVCKLGFGMENVADAVFLDLPSPWEAIPFAKASAKKSRSTKICCFSPCIEQVQRTCIALKENGYFGIEMFECLIKHHEAWRARLPLFHKQKDPLLELEIDQENDDLSKDLSTTILSKPFNTVRGHTSYLTFATLLPEA